MGKARKILQEMLTAVNTFLKDKSFTYFEEVKADFHMFKSQRVFNLVSAKVTKFRKSWIQQSWCRWSNLLSFTFSSDFCAHS